MSAVWLLKALCKVQWLWDLGTVGSVHDVLTENHKSSPDPISSILLCNAENHPESTLIRPTLCREPSQTTYLPFPAAGMVPSQESSGLSAVAVSPTTQTCHQPSSQTSNLSASATESHFLHHTWNMGYFLVFWSTDTAKSRESRFSSLERFHCMLLNMPIICLSHKHYTEPTRMNLNIILRNRNGAHRESWSTQETFLFFKIVLAASVLVRRWLSRSAIVFIDLLYIVLILSAICWAFLCYKALSPPKFNLLQVLFLSRLLAWLYMMGNLTCILWLSTKVSKSL